MTVRFMGNTPSSDFEIEMQRIPGFRPQGSGMVVSHGQCRYRGYADSGGCRRKNETGENIGEDLTGFGKSMKVWQTRMPCVLPYIFCLQIRFCGEGHSQQ